jgi:hypothetical protein
MKNELPIPQAAIDSQQSMEVLRVWIADGDQHISLSGNLWPDPAAWGLLLVDLTKHVASSYANQGRNYDDALRRVRAGFDAEWSNPTDEPTGNAIE